MPPVYYPKLKKKRYVIKRGREIIDYYSRKVLAIWCCWSGQRVIDRKTNKVIYK